AYFLWSYIAPLGLYALWKCVYFGELLPNSFYVKVLHSDHAGLLPGLQYIHLFIISILPLILATLVTLLYSRQRRLAVLLSWPVALLVFYAFVRPLEGLYD